MVFSYDIMFTTWYFPEGTDRREWFFGQRYTKHPTDESITSGSWTRVTAHNLPAVGVNGCVLNEWYHVEKEITIPAKAADGIGTESVIQLYNSNKNVAAQITFRLKNVKLEYGTKATDWSPSPEEVDESILSSSDEIRQELSRQSTSIQADCEGILMSALESYVVTDEFGTYQETVESQFAQLSDEMTMKFTKTQEGIENINGDTQSKFEQMYKHFTFNENGLEITCGENAMSLVIDNDVISFRKNGEQFGWWDGINFYTGNIVVNVNERAQFGNFAFVPRSDGSLSFLKVGG